MCVNFNTDNYLTQRRYNSIKLNIELVLSENYLNYVKWKT